jgi:hypothetical protein
VVAAALVVSMEAMEARFASLEIRIKNKKEKRKTETKTKTKTKTKPKIETRNKKKQRRKKVQKKKKNQPNKRTTQMTIRVFATHTASKNFCASSFVVNLMPNTTSKNSIQSYIIKCISIFEEKVENPVEKSH